MAEILRRLLLRILRVPERPQPPAGDSGSVLTFRAARRYFHYRASLWGLRQLGTLIALVVGTVFYQTITRQIPELTRFSSWGVLELFAWLAFVVQLPVSFALMRLDFEMRWYLLADRSLRIRDGMFVVRELTMSYANIQNISIRRNPLQRIFGLATVAVRAAGGGSGKTEQGGIGQHTHEALFEGVDNADEIRDILRDRIRRHRDSGLGDPDDVHVHEPEPAGQDAVSATRAGSAEAAVVAPAPAHGSRSPAVIAALGLLEEARALRRSLGAHSG